MQRRKALARHKGLATRTRLASHSNLAVRLRRPAPQRTADSLHGSDGSIPETGRVLALRRDSYRGYPVCAAAGWPEPAVRCSRMLDAHHRILIGYGGTSLPDRDILPRLITLCRAHHEWVHGHRKQAEDAGLIVRRGSPRTALDRLTSTPVTYVLSETGWALLTIEGIAVGCPPPEGLAA